ncbi:MAG TPA: DUF1828 domain-containing protein [Armatimonadota bacterium]|jgi:hypothetical protein
MLEALQDRLKGELADEFGLHQVDDHHYRVTTPFQFVDGDHLVVLLKREGDSWVFSDEGHTLMRLTYDFDVRELERGPRRNAISSALATYQVERHDTELRSRVNGEGYGLALLALVQAVIRVSDVSYLQQHRAKSTFVGYLDEVMREVVPARRLAFRWRDPEHDWEGKFPVEYRISAAPAPLFAFALPTDIRVRDATITLLQHQQWGNPHISVGIYKRRSALTSKVLGRFEEVCDIQIEAAGLSRQGLIQEISRYAD